MRAKSSKLYTSRTQEQEATRRRPAYKSTDTSFANDTEAESVVLRPLVLPTLKIGRANSPEERKADEVAHRVVGGGSVGPNGVDRLPGSARGLAVSPAIADRIQARSGQGEKLSEAEREFFEPRFGRAFEDVTIHRDGEAASLARSLNAKAFTVGSDIYFGSGQYSQSEDGRRLMAHELTHTVQQGAGVQREVEVQRAQAGGPVPLQDIIEKLPQLGNHQLERIAQATLLRLIRLGNPISPLGEEESIQRSPDAIQLKEDCITEWANVSFAGAAWAGSIILIVAGSETVVLTVAGTLALVGTTGVLIMNLQPLAECLKDPDAQKNLRELKRDLESLQEILREKTNQDQSRDEKLERLEKKIRQ